MANTIVLNKKYLLPHVVIWEFLVTLSANYVSSNNTIGTPGETLNFNGASNPNYIARPKIPAGPPAGRLPGNNDVKVLNAVDGYDAIVEQNAANPTPANYVMRIFSSGNTELGAGAYSAAQKAEPYIVQVSAPLKFN